MKSKLHTRLLLTLALTLGLVVFQIVPAFAATTFETSKKPHFTFSVLPTERKIQYALERLMGKKINNVERRLNKLLEDVPQAHYEEAKQLVKTLVSEMRTLAEKSLAAVQAGDREQAFEYWHLLIGRFQEAKQLTRYLIELQEAAEDEEVAFEISETDAVSLENQLGELGKYLLVDLLGKLREAASSVPSPDTALAKQYVYEFEDVMRRIYEKAKADLEAGNFEQLRGRLSALKEQVKTGKQLFYKLSRLAGFAPNALPSVIVPTPTTTVAPGFLIMVTPEHFNKIFDKEVSTSMPDLGSLEGKVTSLEKKLRETLARVPEQYRDEMAKHLEQWVSVARGTVADVKSALESGNKEKAYGLGKAVMAHLNAGGQLLRKLLDLAEGVDVGLQLPGSTSYNFGSINIPIAINSYPTQPVTLIPGYINKYAVKPVSATRYEGTLVESQKTGGNGESAVFVIQPGEVVDFVAFVSADQAQAAKEWRFTVPPYKHFVTQKEAVFCQVRFTDTENVLLMQMNGQPSCTTSISYPAQDNLSAPTTDYTGAQPVRPTNAPVFEEQTQPSVTAAPVDVYTKERAEQMVLSAEAAYARVKQMLTNFVASLPQDLHAVGQERVADWVSVTNGTCSDARNAFNTGNFEKAYGLAKACNALVEEHGMNLVKKFKNALEQGSNQNTMSGAGVQSASATAEFAKMANQTNEEFHALYLKLKKQLDSVSSEKMRQELTDSLTELAGRVQDMVRDARTAAAQKDIEKAMHLLKEATRTVEQDGATLSQKIAAAQ